MKIKLNDPVSPPKPYPYIGQSDASIVLFCAPGAGTCLSTALSKESGVVVGAYRTDWMEWQFDPMKGSITLSND